MSSESSLQDASVVSPAAEGSTPAAAAGPPAGIAPLAEVLKYENPRVVRGFLRSFRVPRREAEQLFREVLKYLWLVRQSPRPIMVFGFQQLFDEMWHSFVLHSHDYQEFCERYLGGIVHHEPETRELTREERARARRDFDRLVGEAIEIVYDGLGPATAKLWYETYYRKYTPEYLEAHRVPYTSQPHIRRGASARAPAKRAARR